MNHTFDVIVVGAGHAGTEAALASARMQVKTLLLTHNLDTIGEMSCNPSIGGIGKSHLVKEIDALGGIMAKAADIAGIQFRTLNASKGPAVRATRAQIDRNLYKKALRKFLQQQPNLSIQQQTVDELLLQDEKIIGVKTNLGLTFNAPTVIITAGTFLNGKIHIGKISFSGGRLGCPAAIALAQSLTQLPHHTARLKTGTPPRIARDSIDYRKLTLQPGDTPLPVFSFTGKSTEHPEQIPCHIAHTSEITHDIIRKNLHLSPLYSGIIKGIGPRYCPSIEDKIMRFADRKSHQVFIEPEGLNSNEVYPNGISTSLPFPVQIQMLQSMDGFANAQILRPGYAIEYDFFDPRDLQFSLESKYISGLFFAGQINGTTGYEEAGAQGLIAGINAARKINGEEPWWPRRDQAYIGVMLEDLILRGTEEPYRMFTSRAEYRLMLREDNADLRLTKIGRKLGVIDDERWQIFETKQDAISKETLRLKTIWIRPETPAATIISSLIDKNLEKSYNALDLLRRQDINYKTLIQIPEIRENTNINEQAIEQIEIQMKYAGYIERQQAEIARQRRNETTKIPPDFDYNTIRTLSNEVRQKLIAVRPTTIGQASRIPGMTPAAISILLIYLKNYH